MPEFKRIRNGAELCLLEHRGMLYIDGEAYRVSDLALVPGAPTPQRGCAMGAPVSVYAASLVTKRVYHHGFMQVGVDFYTSDWDAINAGHSSFTARYLDAGSDLLLEGYYGASANAQQLFRYDPVTLTIKGSIGQTYGNGGGVLFMGALKEGRYLFRYLNNSETMSGMYFDFVNAGSRNLAGLFPGTSNSNPVSTVGVLGRSENNFFYHQISRSNYQDTISLYRVDLATSAAGLLSTLKMPGAGGGAAGQGCVLTWPSFAWRSGADELTSYCLVKSADSTELCSLTLTEIESATPKAAAGAPTIDWTANGGVPAWYRGTMRAGIATRCMRVTHNDGRTYLLCAVYERKAAAAGEPGAYAVYSFEIEAKDRLRYLGKEMPSAKPRGILSADDTGQRFAVVYDHGVELWAVLAGGQLLKGPLHAIDRTSPGGDLAFDSAGRLWYLECAGNPLTPAQGQPVLSYIPPLGDAHQVLIRFAQASYAFNGAPIKTTLSVEVFDASGRRVAVPVALKASGPALQFKDGSQQASVESSADEAVTVACKIVAPGQLTVIGSA